MNILVKKSNYLTQTEWEDESITSTFIVGDYLRLEFFIAGDPQDKKVTSIYYISPGFQDILV
jgi:hypothetical protein